VGLHGVASDWWRPRFGDLHVFTKHALMTNAFVGLYSTSL